MLNRRRSIASFFSLVLAALAVLLPAHTAAADNGTIQGVVYADRAVVEDATVVLSNAHGPVARTRTARDGSFSFAEVAPGRYRLDASKEGVGRGRADVGLRSGQTVRVRIALDNTDRAGGVAGVTVSEGAIVGEVSLVLSRGGREIARGMSNAEGRFGFRALAPGEYKIDAAKRGVGRGEATFRIVAGEVTSIRIALRPEAPHVGAIVGLVTGANGPVAEAVVVLRHADREIARVLTDAEGRFGFRGLRPGVYGVSASKRGEGEGATRATVVAGESVRAIIELRQPHGGTLNGFTVNAAGAVAEANVTVSHGGVVVGRAVSGRDGSFSFPNLRPGRYVIEASKRGVGAGRAEADVTAGGTTTIRVALR